MGRLPFTSAAFAGAITMIAGMVLPAQRFIGHGYDDATQDMFSARGSASFVQSLIDTGSWIGTDSGTGTWYRIEGGAVVCGFAIAALAVAAIYAVRYHRGLAFVAAMFGLAASIAVLGTGTVFPYEPDTSFSASPAEGAYVSIAGASVLFLAPVAEFLKNGDR